MRWDSKTGRDIVMFAMGGGGFAHEVIITRGERPTLLVACLALMGVPFFLRRDEDTEKPPMPPTPPESPPSQPQSPRRKRKR